MNRKLSVLIAPVVTALWLMSISCVLAIEIGAAAPDFADLPGTDGKRHSLADYDDAKAVVVVFTCNNCPVAKIYEDRLIALQEDYSPKGVQVVAICVNDSNGDRLEGMIRRAKEKGFNFPYIYDASQKSARAYGATCTPHVFLLDGDRIIVYQGAIDDNNNPQSVKTSWLRDAIDAVLAGKQPPESSTRQRGCGIKWSKK